jgi:hypothetical protein
MIEVDVDEGYFSYNLYEKFLGNQMTFILLDFC